MALTTAAKVRSRLNIDTFEASDAIIADFIAAADGLITHYIGSVPSSGDDNYELAVSISTGLAAYYTGMQIPYPNDKDESKAWIDKMKHIRHVADHNLEILGMMHPVPLPKSTTVD